MNKEQIEQLSEIIGNILVAYDEDEYQSAVGQINNLKPVFSDKDLKNRIDKLLDEIDEDNYDSLLWDFLKGLLQEVRKLIPEELLSYYYAEAYGRNFDDLIGINAEQKENARLIYKRNLEEKLKNADDDEKIQTALEISRDEIKIDILKSLSVIKKIEAIKKVPIEFVKLQVIETIEDPKIIVSLLDELQNDDSKANIIKTFKDDKFKISALDKLKNEGLKKTVIGTIKDDTLKIRALDKLQSEESKAEVIKTLKDDKLKISTLDKLQSEASKVEVIKTLEDDTLKISELSKLQSESNKTKVIKTIKNPEKRLEIALKDLKEDKNKVKFIREIEDPNIKLQTALKELKEDVYKVEFIREIEDPDIRLQTALKELKEYRHRVEFIKEIENPEEMLQIALRELKKDEHKVEFIKEIEDPEERLQKALKELKEEFYKVEFIREIKDPEKRLKTALKELEDENYKAEFIKEIEEPEKRLQTALKELKEDKNKVEFIKEIEDPEERLRNVFKELKDDVNKRIEIIQQIDSSKIVELLNKFEGQEWLEIAGNRSDEEKVEFLDGIDENMQMVLIKTIDNSEAIQRALDKLKNQEHAQILKRLYQTNNDVVKSIDFRILDKKYLDTLGEQKINLISCFPEVQKKILTLTDVQYGVFEKCLNNYLSKKKDSDEWTVVVESILKNLINGQYSELINNIDNIEELDISKLTKLLQLSNDIGLTTVEHINKYEQIRKQKCDEIINGNLDIKEKKKAVFLKIFGTDLQYVETIIKKYGDDIERLEDCDEKYYVMAMKLLMQVTDENILKQIYSRCEEVEILDKAYTERTLKTSYGKMFNKGLYKAKDENELEEDKMPEELKRLGVKVYDAGTDFKMIITSVAPFQHNNPTDFKKDWNRPAIASQHFCASYIRSDMIGIPPIPHLCYGFGEMKEDALMLSGSADILSSATGFVSDAKRFEKYYSPDEQINRTTNKYNEMDFRRIQGGEKKQPDYIVAFKRNGQIDNIQKIAKAIQDWECEIPIVIVDVDECLKQQRQQVDDMIKQYNESKSLEKAREILQKVRNNGMTKSTFCEDIQGQLDEIRCYIEEQTKQHVQDKVTKDELKVNSQGVSTQERRDGVKEIKELYKQMHRVIQEKEKKTDSQQADKLSEQPLPPPPVPSEQPLPPPDYNSIALSKDELKINCQGVSVQERKEGVSQIRNLVHDDVERKGEEK